MSENDQWPSINRRSALKKVAWICGAIATLPAYSIEKKSAELIFDLLEKQNKKLWDRVLNSSQSQLLSALSDIVFPSDPYGPSASELEVPEFMEEWISAPFKRQQKDRKKIVFTLERLEELSLTEYNQTFVSLREEQQTDLLDKVILLKNKQHKKLYKSFLTFKKIAGVGYYTDPIAGWKAIGYMGNSPSSYYKGPPEEVLQLLGVNT